jgi:hypothetical protein
LEAEMAGAITHLLIAEDAADTARTYHPGLGKVLEDFRPFLMLGAVSPDLPYLKPSLHDQKAWADNMHYTTTNLLSYHCMIGIGTSHLLGRPEGDAQLAWLAGYISHCVADATIHPLVQEIVGPYHGHEDEHRRCEMFQDSLLFTERKGCDLRGSQYVDILTKVGPDELSTHLLDLWHDALYQTYGNAGPEPKTKGWYAFYKTLLNGSVDGDLLQKLSRPFSGVQDLLYKSGPELRKKFSDDVQRFYESIPIPNGAGELGRFEDRGYQYAVQNTLPVWSALMGDLKKADGIREGTEQSALVDVLKDWNLDTGEDRTLPGAPVTYWAKSA